MQINIRNKIRSLLRRKQNFFCLSYDWDTKDISIHMDDDQYFSIITSHLENGFVKRTQCYLDESLQIEGSEQYMIYMVSFGDFRRGKMIYGENPIARGFGVCIFDFVYFFVQQKKFAKNKMRLRIMELQKKGDIFYASLMKQIFQKYYQTDIQFSERTEENQQIIEDERKYRSSYIQYRPSNTTNNLLYDNQKIWAHDQFSNFKLNNSFQMQEEWL